MDSLEGEMNKETLSILESKLHHLGSLELDRGLTLEEEAIQEKLYREYVKEKNDNSKTTTRIKSPPEDQDRTTG